MRLPTAQELRRHEIHTAAAQESRELLLQPNDRQTRHMPHLEFDEDIDIAVRVEVVARRRAQA